MQDESNSWTCYTFFHSSLISGIVKRSCKSDQIHLFQKFLFSFCLVFYRFLFSSPVHPLTQLMLMHYVLCTLYKDDFHRTRGKYSENLLQISSTRMLFLLCFFYTKVVYFCKFDDGYQWMISKLSGWVLSFQIVPKLSSGRYGCNKYNLCRGNVLILML